MTERPNPGAIDAAKEELAKSSKLVLTQEFAGRVNNLVCLMEDDTKIRTLFGSWDPLVYHRLQSKDGGFTQPNDEWADFMEKIDHQEYVHLKKVVRTAVRFFDCVTLGDLRELFSKPYLYSRIGPRGRAFGLLAFHKQEPQINQADNLTLGL